MKILAQNKRALFDYHLEEKLEAGMVLTGAEVKSCKLGQVQLKSSYITLHASLKGGFEVFLINAHISPYKFAAGQQTNYDPKKSRKLLMHKKEINKIIGLKSQGLTIVPVKLYSKRGKVKLEIALARSKKRFDKRESIKKRETDRDTRRALRGK